MSARAVPRVAAHDASWSDFIPSLLAMRSPIIIEAPDVALLATQGWSIAALRQWGSRSVPVYVAPTNEFLTVGPNQRTRVVRELGTVIDDVLAAPPDGSERVYLQGCSLSDHLSELSAVAPPPGIDLPELVTGSNLWIAPEGVVTPLHFDRRDNIFLQIEGAKTWLLAPPEDFPLLSTVPADAADPYASAKRLGSYLDRNEAPCPWIYQADVTPGCVLIIPAFWWHEVVATSPSASINHWVKVPAPDVLVRGFERLLSSNTIWYEPALLADHYVDLRPLGGDLIAFALYAARRQFVQVAALLVALHARQVFADSRLPHATEILSRAEMLRFAAPQSVTIERFRQLVADVLAEATPPIWTDDNLLSALRGATRTDDVRTPG